MKPGTDYDGTPLPDKPIGKRAQREAVRSMLLDYVAVGLGYWSERDPKAAARLGITDAELDDLLKAEADRIARLFGYDEAWYA